MTLQEVSIGELASLKYGKMPKRDILLDSDEGFPVYSGYRVTGYAKEFLYQEPMLIVVARGVGGTGDVKISPPQSWITNLSIVLNVKEEIADKSYLLYKLNGENLKEKLNTGAAQAQITIENLASYKLKLPHIEVQKRISYILSTFDDLIENNMRRIELLEKSARLLYEEWFVRLRFPGYEHTWIRNGVPDGWDFQTIGDSANLTMGQSPPSEFYNDERQGLPFHQGVTNFGGRFVLHEIYCIVRNRIAESGDILCSVRAPVGRLNLTLDKIIIGRGLAALRSKIGFQSFLFYQLKNHFFKEDIIGAGAIFASVTKKDLMNQKMLTPSTNLIQMFENYSTPVDKQIRNLFVQNQKLKQARDLLLPKLMNGEIAV